MKSKSIFVVLFATLAAATALWAMPATARAQIFVVNHQNGTIGEYTTSGATVNASLISGLNNPGGVAVSGTNLFVVNNGTNSIGKYTTAGATVNASLITGLNGPIDIAVVPEPSTWAMLATGAGALLLFGRCYRHRRRDRSLH
jgi:hypothetical protein